jgi:hypothetical protein
LALTRSERLALFIERLSAAPAANSTEEALILLAATLNGVEDEFTTIPFDLSRSDSDGRMYPPLPDSARDVPGRPTSRAIGVVLTTLGSPLTAPFALQSLATESLC